METIVDLSRSPSANQDRPASARPALLWATYVGYLSVVLMPLALAVTAYQMWRHRRVQMIPYEPGLLTLSHYRWLGRTAVLGGIAMMVAAGHFYYGVGIITTAAVLIWYFYRIVRGMVVLARLEPAPLAELTTPEAAAPLKR